MFSRSFLVLFLINLFVMTACSEGGKILPDQDAKVDVLIDSFVDATMDAKMDIRMDSFVDATMDAAIDAQVDAETDSVVDALIDAATDSVVDAQADVGNVICSSIIGNYVLTQKMGNPNLCSLAPNNFNCTIRYESSHYVVHCPDAGIENADCNLNETTCVCATSTSRNGYPLESEFDVSNTSAQATSRGTTCLYDLMR